MGSVGAASHRGAVKPVGDADGWWRVDTCSVGVRNYLVEGVSGTGKTSVCEELNRRGYHAIHGDRELAYQGDA